MNVEKKNSEGYLDMTLFKALTNINKEKKAGPMSRFSTS